MGGDTGSRHSQAGAEAARTHGHRFPHSHLELPLASRGSREAANSEDDAHGVGGQSEAPVLSPGRHEAVLPGQGARDGRPAVGRPEADVGGEGRHEHAPSVGLLCPGVGILTPQSSYQTSLTGRISINPPRLLITRKNYLSGSQSGLGK